MLEDGSGAQLSEPFEGWVRFARLGRNTGIKNKNMICKETTSSDFSTKMIDATPSKDNCIDYYDSSAPACLENMEVDVLDSEDDVGRPVLVSPQKSPLHLLDTSAPRCEAPCPRLFPEPSPGPSPER
ncbi:unnamed protein product [Amoebophrya sp. A120]|nr:unnamed protein product [Amoebophrya sp. A120]|eukprot:GSA120T00016932001.1